MSTRPRFEASERLAEKFGITRSDCDEFGKLSQDRAARAWSEGRYDSQVLSVEAPAASANMAPRPRSIELSGTRDSEKPPWRLCRRSSRRADLTECTRPGLPPK